MHREEYNCLIMYNLSSLCSFSLLCHFTTIFSPFRISIYLFYHPFLFSPCCSSVPLLSATSNNRLISLTVISSFSFPSFCSLSSKPLLFSPKTLTHAKLHEVAEILLLGTISISYKGSTPKSQL